MACYEAKGKWEKTKRVKRRVVEMRILCSLLEKTHQEILTTKVRFVDDTAPLTTSASSLEHLTMRLDETSKKIEMKMEDLLCFLNKI